MSFMDSNSRKPWYGIVGESEPMQRLVGQIERVLDSDVTVSIFGESGTGKELVARAIHEGGPRRAKPFVGINCAAIPPSLQESELFGYERGAFTGATQRRAGCLEQANGGSLFLDEIGDMSLSAQALLLRALQERAVRRLGGSEEVSVDARIICATRRDLSVEMERGSFREDLYFRLVVYPIEVPALRDRLDDVVPLVEHTLRKLEPRRRLRVSAEVVEALQRHRWPGNVRELINVIHRSVIVRQSEEIGLADLPPYIAGRMPTPPRCSVISRVSTAPPTARFEARQPSLPRGEPVVPLRELESAAIKRALAATDGNVSKAARLLGIGRATLYRRMARMPAAGPVGPDCDFEQPGQIATPHPTTSPGAHGAASRVFAGDAPVQ